MINLKIKTLDSRDHDFSVEESMTVRQFKEHIVVKTGIDADMQRLIYCGRVLNDEKPLNEYNLNGKVVHLVERAPPRTRTAEEQLTDLLNRHRHHTHHHRGAPNLSEPNGGPSRAGGNPLTPSSTLCTNRIIVARYMLSCVDNIVTYLDNPELGLNNSQMDINYQQTMESTVFEVGISTTVPHHNMHNFVHAFQGAVSNVFGQNVLSNIELMHPTVELEDLFARQSPLIVLGGPPSNPSAPSQASAASTAADTATTSTGNPPSSARTRSLSAPNTHSDPLIGVNSYPRGRRTGETSSTSSATSSANSSPARSQTTSPTVLAEVVQQMRTVQTRLEPYLQQYYDLLLNERQFEPTEATLRENMQRVFDRVSEALHYMSHAQHAISDLMLDLTQNTPRFLNCRPILIEQSAYQSMIPLPRGAGISVNNNESAAPNNNNAIPHVILDLSNLAMPLVNPQPANVSNQNQPPAPPTAAGSATPPTDGAPNAPTMDENVPTVARLIQGIINQVSLYSNLQVDLHMIDDGEVMNQQPEADANNSPTDAPPSDEQMPAADRFNLVPDPTLGGQLTDNTAFTGTTAAPASATNPATAGQPRVTTATHPTTATQTRSTTRPQVHLHRIEPNRVTPAEAFDRFMPCNSHHVRDNHQNLPISSLVRRRNPVRRAFATTINLNGGRSQSPSGRQRPSVGLPIYHSTDFTQSVNIFDGSMTIQELLHIVPNAAAFHRNRLNWRRYLLIRLGEVPTEERWNDVYVVLAYVLDSSPLRNLSNARYHVIHSIHNLLRHSLPPLADLILNDESPEFGARCLRLVVEFINRLMNVLVVCVGRQMAASFLTDVVVRAVNAENQLTARHILTFVRHLLHAIQTHMAAFQANEADVQEYLVITLPPVPTEEPTARAEAVVPMDTDEVVNVSSPTNQAVQTAQDATETVESAAIATGSVSVDAARNTPLGQLSSSPPPQLAIDSEPLPRVLIGSEPWHAHVPNAWVPMITRDIGRQRRTSAQAPYSDAYLSGMSSKRRKVIASERPSTSDPRTILGESVQAAVRQRPNTSGAASAALTAIEQNTALQGPLEQTMRTLVRNRLQNDADYDPARYPNTDKWSSNPK